MDSHRHYHSQGFTISSSSELSQMASASAFTISPSFPTSSCHKSKRNPISSVIFCQKGSQFGLRREILKGFTLLPLSLPLFEPIIPLPSVSKEIEVGSYLPPSQSDPSFVFFKASPSDTPALRAGIMTFFCIFLYHNSDECS